MSQCFVALSRCALDPPLVRARFLPGGRTKLLNLYVSMQQNIQFITLGHLLNFNLSASDPNRHLHGHCTPPYRSRCPSRLLIFEFSDRSLVKFFANIRFAAKVSRQTKLGIFGFLVHRLM